MRFIANSDGWVTCILTHRHYQSQSLPKEGCGRGSGSGLFGQPVAAVLGTSLSAFQRRAERGSLSLSHWSAHTQTPIIITQTYTLCCCVHQLYAMCCTDFYEAVKSALGYLMKEMSEDIFGGQIFIMRKLCWDTQAASLPFQPLATHKTPTRMTRFMSSSTTVSLFFPSPPPTKPFLLSSDTGSVNKFTYCASLGMLVKQVALFTFTADVVLCPFNLW